MTWLFDFSCQNNSHFLDSMQLIREVIFCMFRSFKVCRLPVFYSYKLFHDDIMPWKRFLRYWPFVRGIHRSQNGFPSQRAWTNGWKNHLVIGELALQWCHNEFDDVSNHRRLDCFFHRFSRSRSKKTSKFCVTGFVRESTGDRWIPLTKAQQRGKCFHLTMSLWAVHHSILR